MKTSDTWPQRRSFGQRRAPQVGPLPALTGRGGAAPQSDEEEWTGWRRPCAARSPATEPCNGTPLPSGARSPCEAAARSRGPGGVEVRQRAREGDGLHAVRVRLEERVVLALGGGQVLVGRVRLRRPLDVEIGHLLTAWLPVRGLGLGLVRRARARARTRARAKIRARARAKAKA